MASQCFVVAAGECWQSKEGRVSRTLGPNSSFGEHERLGELPKAVADGSEAPEPAAQELLGDLQERLADLFRIV